MVIKENLEDKISDAADIAKICKSILSAEPQTEQDKEHFWAIGLDAKNRIKYIDLVSLGTATASLIHPRETFRLAVMYGVISIIVCHNHPSGDTEPSREDKLITERLKEAGGILGIPLLDHIIIGDAYCSMLDKGVM